MYEQLFVAAGGREAVDRRHQWVRSVLAQAATPPPPVILPAPAPSEPSEPPAAEGGDAGGPSAPGAPEGSADPGCPLERGPAAADGIVRASFRARIRRRSGGRRVLVVEVEARQAVDARVVLTQRGRPLGERTVSCLTGRRTIVVSLPKRLSPGRAQLAVELRDRAGDAKVATRTLRVPARVRAGA